MASYIKKTVCNLDVYYQGNDKWTNKFEDRKKYNTASDGNTSQIRLNATASTTSGAGTMYLYGSSPFFAGLTPITNA
jgi:hypothetical protein